jgi:hypothetical protein
MRVPSLFDTISRIRIRKLVVLIGSGSVMCALLAWFRTPALDTFEDECFMPTGESLGGILEGRFFLSCTDAWEPSDPRLGDWLTMRKEELESSESRLKLKVHHLGQMQAICSDIARRCSPISFLFHLNDCAARRFDSHPWYAHTRTLSALREHESLELAAVQIAICALDQALCDGPRLMESRGLLVTDEGCCPRTWSPDPALLELLPQLGVYCPRRGEVLAPTTRL